jgi:NADH-quinone oxidoreductase subunit N
MSDSFWFPTLTELNWFSPELALVGTLVAILVAALVLGRSAKNAGFIAFAGAIVTLFLTWRVGNIVRDGGLSGLAPPMAEGMLIVDNLTVYFRIVLMLFMAGVTVLWFIGSADREEHGEEFFVLLVGSALGMSLMASTLNLLMIAIAIELASLPSYAIVAFNKRNSKSAEASLKYVIFGGVSAAIMLYGISLLYGMFGSLQVGDVAYGVVRSFSIPGGQNVAIISLGLFCFFAGIAFKIAAVPFHFWCPDVFEGAQIEVTTWLSVSSKAAALVLLVRMADTFTSATAAASVSVDVLSGLAWGLGIVAAVTCTWGNFAAYRQTNVKRLLAYSSIAHAGYIMMAVAVLVHPERPLEHSPMVAVLVYILVYAIMNLGAFSVTAMVTWQTKSEDIDAFSGLGRRAPWLAVPMVCCLVSLVGLPPFAGFIAKVWILLTLGEAGGTLYWSLLIVAVLNTLVSLFFYFRIIKAMFLVDRGDAEFSPPIVGVAIANVCAIALVALGVVFIQEPRDIARAHSDHLFMPAALKSAVLVEGDVVPEDRVAGLVPAITSRPATGGSVSNPRNQK